MTSTGGDSRRTATPRDAFAAAARPVLLPLAFLAWVGGIVVTTALLGPPLFDLLEGSWPGLVSLPRLLRRLVIPLGAGLLWWILRRLGVRHWRQIGATREGWRAGYAGPAAAAAFVATLALFAVELAAGDRIVQWEGAWWRPAQIVVSAALIALIEELVFRGAFLFPFGRLRGAGGVVQALLLPGVYAAAHFARGQPRTIAPTWNAGFELWAALVRSAAQHPEAFSGLFALGLFLHLLARRQGHVWGAVGVHAGAVAALQMGGDWSAGVDPHHTLFFADGLLPGWGAATLLGAACLVLLLRGAPGSTGAGEGPAPT